MFIKETRYSVWIEEIKYIYIFINYFNKIIIKPNYNFIASYVLQFKGLNCILMFLFFYFYKLMYNIV